MGFYDDLIEGLETAIREDHDGVISRLAKDADTHPSTLTRIVEKERTKWINQIARIADAAGLVVYRKDNNFPVQSLAPHGPSGELAVIHPGDIIPDGLGAVFPVYHLVAGGLPLAIEDGIEPLCQTVIPQKFIFPGLLVAQVAGNSMAPTIRDGAYIGINQHEKKIVPGETYVVDVPYEGSTVKRVFVDVPNGQLILRSDNPTHEDIHVDIDGRDTLIIGRVFWVTQEI